jgi:ketosteroid isomerase-like protein
VEESMSAQENTQLVKDFFLAIRAGDRDALLKILAPDIEWIIPGDSWPLAGTHRGHEGINKFFKTAAEKIETSTEPTDWVAQGDRVIVLGYASGKIKATNKTFEDHWVFAFTVQNKKVARIREYVDTQALARASNK